MPQQLNPNALQHGKENRVSESIELLTVTEVAKRLRVDVATVRRWILSGTLEAITLPHSGKRQAYRVKQSTLDQILQGGKSS